MVCNTCVSHTKIGEIPTCPRCGLMACRHRDKAHKCPSGGKKPEARKAA